jgi:multidrug efflux pump subunit AcrB
MQIEALGGQSPQELTAGAQRAARRPPTKDPRIAGAYSTFSADNPQLYLDLDRTKAQYLDVPVSTVFDTMQSVFGTTYVNNFTYLGRTFQVNVQGEDGCAPTVEDIGSTYVRSNNGAMVPGRRAGEAARTRRRSDLPLQRVPDRARSTAPRRRATPPARRWRPWRRPPSQGRCRTATVRMDRHVLSGGAAERR